MCLNHKITVCTEAVVVWRVGAGRGRSQPASWKKDPQISPAVWAGRKVWVMLRCVSLEPFTTAQRAGESVSCVQRQLPLSTGACFNLSVWSGTDTCSVALVHSQDKCDGVTAFSTTWTLQYAFWWAFTAIWTFPCLCLQNKVLGEGKSRSGPSEWSYLLPAEVHAALGPGDSMCRSFGWWHFNPMEPIEHMAKHLLSIRVLQQLPFPQHLLEGEWGNNGVFTLGCPHTALFLPSSCPQTDWETCCGLLKGRWSFGCLGDAQAFLNSCIKIRDKYSYFSYCNQLFYELWKDLVCWRAFMLTEELVFMLCFVSVCQLLPYPRYFAPPLIPETLG